MLKVLSLGAGVQSSVIALMAEAGEIEKPDCAIFADTQFEPLAVYDHLEWLEKQLSFPVYRVTAGDLRGDVVKAATEKVRVSNPPFFVSKDGKDGRLFRSCTRDYKLYPIQSKIRELLGLKRVMSKTPLVSLWIGISTDEAIRMKPSRLNWIENTFPLIDAGMSRRDCLTWFASRYPGKLLPKSSCIGCPHHDDNHWNEMKQQDSQSWDAAVDWDHAIRGGIYKTENELFLHRSLRPLGEINFDRKNGKQRVLFAEECEGMCGT